MKDISKWVLISVLSTTMVFIMTMPLWANTSESFDLKFYSVISSIGWILILLYAFYKIWLYDRR